MEAMVYEITGTRVLSLHESRLLLLSGRGRSILIMQGQWLQHEDQFKQLDD